MAYIALQDVTKVYKTGEIEIHAADGISFEMEKGEFVVIVGPSGAGKTTVLNILGGMDSATSGTVFVDGEDVAKYNAKRLTRYRREDVGFVFQFYNLVQNLTAQENVELAQQIVKNLKSSAEVLEEVGLTVHQVWPAYHLSRIYLFAVELDGYITPDDKRIVLFKKAQEKNVFLMRPIGGYAMQENLG